MGICSGVGYLGVTGVKVYMFGWEDVPVYWLWAGGGLFAAMAFVWFFHHRRDRRVLREVIQRSAVRPSIRPASDNRAE